MTSVAPQSVIYEEQAYAHFVEVTAKACHEANRSFCKDIGDTVMPEWEDASASLKQSIYNGVINILKNPDITPEESHLNWKREKISSCWVYGPVYNESARFHPNIVKNYDDLSEEQKAKDYIFIEVVRDMLAQYTASISE